MVPLLQVQLVQALAFQESPASSTSPSLVMQYSCWLLFTGSNGPSSAVTRTQTHKSKAAFLTMMLSSEAKTRRWVLGHVPDRKWQHEVCTKRPFFGGQNQVLSTPHICTAGCCMPFSSTPITSQSTGVTGPLGATLKISCFTAS